jgi:hypothetical protein
MAISKVRRDKSEVVVKIKNGSQGIDEIVIKDIDKKICLGGDTYHKYRIIRPRGHEQAEIFHRQDRGYEALLSEVFMVLDHAGAAKRRPKPHALPRSLTFQ